MSSEDELLVEGEAGDAGDDGREALGAGLLEDFDEDALSLSGSEA